MFFRHQKQSKKGCIFCAQFALYFVFYPLSYGFQATDLLQKRQDLFQRTILYLL